MEWMGGSQEERIRRMGISHLISVDKVRNLKCVGKEQAGWDGCLRASVTTRHDLVIQKGYVVQGNIKCCKNVRLEDGCVVCGDVKAAGNVYVGRYVQIYGALSAGRNIQIQEGARIGRAEQPKAVCARRELRLSEKCCIYGGTKARLGIRIFTGEA